MAEGCAPPEGVLLRKLRRGFVDVEDGDVAAAGVDGEEKGVVLAEGERALRLKWVGDASAAAAVGVVGDAFAEGAVGGAFEGDDFVFVRGVGHDEDSAGGVFGLCRGKSWKCGANSDGEHQETSSYFQHLLAPWEDGSRKAEEGR